MKALKTVLILVLFLSMTLGAPALAESHQPQPVLKTGDYILFGHYYDKPVLWRVVRTDEKGNPMLITDRIITIKPYDAKGTMKADPAWPPAVIRDREHYGSNYWPYANIRQWLNSFADKIEWAKSPPSKTDTFMSDNPYDQEKGFLADGNFTAYERSMVLVVTHKTILSTVDKGLKDGGSEILASNGDIAQIMQNYETSYYQMVADGVFLPDVKDIHDIYLAESILGKDYWRAKPTQEAIDNSTYKNAGLAVDKYWSYWLRTPFAGDGEPIQFVKYDGKIDFDTGYGYDGSIGIRPCLWLNGSSGLALVGSGSAEAPFELQQSREITKNNNQVLLVSTGAILVVFLMVFSQKGARRKKRKRV